MRALAAAFNSRADKRVLRSTCRKSLTRVKRLRTAIAELLSPMIREVLDQAEGEPDRLLLYIDQWKELYTGLLSVDRPCRWRDV